MTPDLLDKSIAIAIMLFILSMISERIITWFKIKFGKCGHWFFLFSRKHQDLTIRKIDPEEEKLREQKITGLNIVLSIIIACIARADLFRMFRFDEPFKSLGWHDYSPNFDVIVDNFDKVIVTLIGCCLSGLFISLGSKFWHDTLDLLFHTKNLKAKLSDSHTYEVTDIKKLKEYLEFSENDMVNLAIAQNEQVLKIRFPNIRFINDTTALVQGQEKRVMAIYCSDNNTAGMPATIPVRLPSGASYSVDSIIITDTGSATVANGLLGNVMNKRLLGSAGSGCCILHNGRDHYLLTNCHVLTSGFYSAPLYNVTDTVLYNHKTIGKWYYGNISALGDLALVKLDSITKFLSQHQPEKFGNKFRAVDKVKDKNLRVTARANKCKVNPDVYIVDIVFDKISVEYKGGTKQLFREVILLGDRPDLVNSQTPCDSGDSGGIIYDNQNMVLGIITAKDKRYGYAIPIGQFLNDFKLKIL